MGAGRRYGLTNRNAEARLERWLGGDVIDTMKAQSVGLTIPVPIMGVPACLMPDGSFAPRVAGGGFTSLSDLISEATGGKSQDDIYQQAGTTGVVATANTLWNVGALPAAGGVGGALPGGTVPTNSTTGAHKFTNPGGSDTLHLTTWTGIPSVAGMSLMLYDRLWFCTYNHATATSTNVTGVPTRYQTAAQAAGSFLSMEVTTALSATAHTLTFTYMDQDGNAAEAGAALAARVSAAANQVPFTTPNWFYPLNAGDTGLRNITVVAQSTIAAVTGISNIFIGHPLAILPQPAANAAYVLDGINSAFNLVEVKTGACLTLMEFVKSATTATNYTGALKLVSG